MVKDKRLYYSRINVNTEATSHTFIKLSLIRTFPQTLVEHDLNFYKN